MMRLINYLLYIVTLFVFLAIVIPYGLFESEYKHIMTQANPEAGLANLANPNFNIVGSLISFFIFTFIAIGLVFVQQWLWITNIQKHNDYPIHEKYLKKYKWSGLITLIGIGFLYFWFFTTWAVNIDFNHNDLKSIQSVIKIRRALYISGIVIVALIGFGSIGFSAYVNLMIAYQQQVSFVDDMIEQGEYDPITREPIKDKGIKLPDTEDITITEYDNNTTNEPIEYVGSSRLVVDNKENKLKSEDEKN